MTLDPQPLHIDAAFCAEEAELGRPLMNSLFTLGLMIGMSVNDFTVGTTVAQVGMTDVRFPPSVVRGRYGAGGDPKSSRRAARNRPRRRAWSEFQHRAFKQRRHAQVAECRARPSCAASAETLRGITADALACALVPAGEIRGRARGLKSGAAAW